MAFCLRLTLFTLRFLMSVNTGIKPEQIAAWEQTELLHLICLLCLQVNHGNRSETCLLMTNLLMALFDRAPWPWAPPWRTRCDVHSVNRGLSSLRHNKVQAAEDCHNIYATCSIITHSLNCQSRNEPKIMQVLIQIMHIKPKSYSSLENWKLWIPRNHSTDHFAFTWELAFQICAGLSSTCSLFSVQK